jgi:hypothetical protein
MPLTEKGSKIKSAMQEKYGKEKGESVFYASRNKGTIKGVDAAAGEEEGGVGAESWVGSRKHTTGYRIEDNMSKFRTAIRDALDKGMPIGDAIKCGCDAAMDPPDPEARKQNFFKGVKDSIAKGRTASQAIGDALGGAPFRR